MIETVNRKTNRDGHDLGGIFGSHALDLIFLLLLLLLLFFITLQPLFPAAAAAVVSST